MAAACRDDQRGGPRLLAGPRRQAACEGGQARLRRAYSWARRAHLHAEVRVGVQARASRHAAARKRSLNGTTKPPSAASTSSTARRQRAGHHRDAAGHVLGDGLVRHRVAEVLLVRRRDRPAREPLTTRPEGGSAFGTKPCQCTASPPASMCARAAASAWPISSTAIPCGLSRRPSCTISAEPRSGDSQPTYTTRRGPPGGPGRLPPRTYLVVLGTTGWSRAARSARCSRARPRIRCRLRSGQVLGPFHPLRPLRGRSHSGSQALVVQGRRRCPRARPRRVGGRLAFGGRTSEGAPGRARAAGPQPATCCSHRRPRGAERAPWRLPDARREW